MTYRELLAEAARLGATDRQVGEAVSQAVQWLESSGEEAYRTDGGGDTWPNDAACEIASAELRSMVRGW